MTRPEKARILTLILFALTWLSLLGLAVSVVHDYAVYNTVANSAPFSTFVLVRVIQFVPVTVITYILGRLIKNVAKKEIKTTFRYNSRPR